MVSDVADTVLENLSNCFGILKKMQDDHPPITGYSTPKKLSGGPGCSKFDISIEQLEHLLQAGLDCSSVWGFHSVLFDGA